VKALGNAGYGWWGLVSHREGFMKVGSSRGSSQSEGVFVVTPQESVVFGLPNHDLNLLTRE
jgi:hypothetical protein